MRLDLLKNFVISSFFFVGRNRIRKEREFCCENKRWIYVLLYLMKWWSNSELFIGMNICKYVNVFEFLRDVVFV